MPAPLRLSHAQVDQVTRFVTALRAAGLTPWRTTQQAARSFSARLQRAGGWARLSRARQLDATKKAPGFAAWLMVTGQLTVTAEFLSRADLRLGISARHFCPEAYTWFSTVAERLGVRPADTTLQWSTLAKIAAFTRTAPDVVGPAEFEQARTAIVAAFLARGSPCAGRNMAAIFHRLQLTLFHAGRLETYTRPRNRPPVSVRGWVVVAPGVADVARRYVDQVALSLRPSTVAHIEHDLREFGTWLAEHHPSVASCADLERPHIERHRPITALRIATALRRFGADAGIGHVTAHQLRHTLATQAINRGMSLDAIAALLGHKTLAMTMIYARIADKTVADEYFKVTEKVEALYQQPRQLPATDEGTEMRRLRAEMYRRMLGNGYCARPVDLDCHFESICESCTFFVTTIAFRPTLQQQRDDAERKGQVGRQKIFDGLLTRLDKQEAAS